SRKPFPVQSCQPVTKSKYKHIHTYTHTHIHSHTHIHTHTPHTHTHTHTHTCSQQHGRSLSSQRLDLTWQVGISLRLTAWRNTARRHVCVWRRVTGITSEGEQRE